MQNVFASNEFIAIELPQALRGPGLHQKVMSMPNRRLALTLLLVLQHTVAEQSPHLGKPADAAMLKAWKTDIFPNGERLPGIQIPNRNKFYSSLGRLLKKPDLAKSENSGHL